MKDKQFWFNLPVNDVNLSRKFYLDIGFELNTQFQQNDEAASLYVGDKKIILMLFPTEVFKGFVKNDATNTSVSSEVLFNLSADNKSEVDAITTKVKEAGGAIYQEPVLINGWMYGLGFEDPDGHRWNQVYMDFSKAPTADSEPSS
jgi:predicted lactoylglutathione lyase